MRRDLPNGVAMTRSILKSALLHVWDVKVTPALLNASCSRGFIDRCQRTVQNSGHTSESLGHLKELEEQNVLVPYWEREENQYRFWDLPNQGILGDHPQRPHPW